MPGTKEFYRITKRDGNWTSFHFVDSTLIPVSNFELALKWHNAKQLIAASLRDMETLLSNTAIKKRYKKFLEGTNKILYLERPNKRAMGS